MKKLGIGILTLALALTSLFASAQGMETKEKTKGKGAMADKLAPTPGHLKDGYIMLNGKMMVMRGGKPVAMTEDATLTNGTTIMRDGTVKMADGTSKTMQNGDQLDLEGTMSHNHGSHMGKGHEEHGDAKAASEKSKMKMKDNKMKVDGKQGDSKVKYDK